MISEDKEKRKDGLLQFLSQEITAIRDSLSSGQPFDFLNAVEQLEAKRSAFISQYRKIPIGCESFFVVLRKWNSFTPSLPVESEKPRQISQYSIGGGYYLYIQGQENELSSGYGLVIDPGYNFIHNFGLSGFCLDDIDGIFITHAHNDHTNDFESLLSLLFQRNDKHIGNRTPKKVDLFLNVGSFKKFSNYLDLANKDSKNYIGRVTVMSPGQVIKITGRDDLDLEIYTLYTKHHEIITADYSLGVCFKISGRTLLLTGDTGWDFNLALKNEEFLKEHGVNTRESSGTDNIDVLVAHIGTIKREEFTKEKITDLQYYKKHLGLLGTISIVEQWKPELCIISEFGEELTDIRNKLSKSIENTAKKLYPKIRCLPGDIGLFIFMDSRKSLCYHSGELVEWEKINYKDLEEEGHQRTIKYYSDETFPPLGNKDEIVDALSIKNGLGRYKHYYLAMVRNGFNLQGKDMPTLIKEIADHPYGSLDPWSMEENELFVTGRLFALSCLTNSPMEVFDACVNGYNTGHVSLFLKNYNINTTHNGKDIFKEFMLHCSTLGFEENKDEKATEEYLIYEKSKSLLSDIVEAFKNNELPKAAEILSRIKDITITSVWNEISNEKRVDILCENSSDFKKLHLKANETALVPFIAKYEDIRKKLSAEKDDFIKLCATADEKSRCWMGAYSVDTEALKTTLNETDDPDKKKLLEQAISKSEQLDQIIKAVTDLGKEYMAKLKTAGIEITSSVHEERNFFYALSALIELKNNSKHPEIASSVDMQKFEDALKI